MIRIAWILLAVLVTSVGMAQEVIPPASTAAEVVPAPQTPDSITLMMMIEQGGVILWVIMGLGFIAVALALYLLLTVSPRREAPKKIVKRARAQVLAGEFEGARQMCMEGDELLARVLAAGLKFVGHDRYVIQESMENEGERGATALWQRITYLNNIATISPLLGLLGTVWGMMNAFSAIALDTAQVKGISMAYSVSQAMITTAAGLLVAIPAMAVYFYLRGRVIRIVAEVEAQSSEFIELLMEEGRK
ncbi:MAG: MotA/TolQ/ExbB proton channel family protein [Candidatus Hydrogenedentes bacterium]|nr:MotA/TolQ/ExbB proton channel family protein [Candidatus Hydrogenedentota bacterium]